MYIFKIMMRVRAKEAFYEVCLDQFYKEKFLHLKLHIWVSDFFCFFFLGTQDTFRKVCNIELMCKNLAHSNAKSCLEIITFSNN